MTDWAREQALRTASDLGRVYARAEADRRSLSAVTEAAVALAGAVSLEEAAASLCRASAELFDLSAVGVYLLRADRLSRQAQWPESSGFAARGVPSADLEALGGEVDSLASPPWTELLPGAGELSVVPLVGRQSLVGFLAAGGQLPANHGVRADLLVLLARYAGVTLEGFLFEERRGRTLRRRLGSVTKVQAPAQPGLGASPPMQAVGKLVEKLCRVDSPVLLLGETGTGKSLVARAIHDGSPRRQRPFVAVNCAAIPEALVESELFGHEAGAFSGATRAHRGKVQQAEGGTLFLDEVGELPLAVQSKLLTFLEGGRFSTVGGEKELQANVRILSATNADLARALETKSFRSDLLYRLNVFSVELPPLRERGADVTALARALAAEVAVRYDLTLEPLSPEVEARLLEYHWPGNVRELRNVMEKAVILGDGRVEASMLPGLRTSAPAGSRAQVTTTAPRAESMPVGGDTFAEAKAGMIERWEAAYVESLLRSTGGNMSQAARVASMDKKNLQRKVATYGIDVDQIRAAQ